VEGTALEAAETLPPTPNESACACVESKLTCLFSSKQSDDNALIGTLTGQACGLLGQVKGNCDDISTNGTTGTYGIVAMCDPAVRLSYAFSQYYDLTNRLSTSCDFQGNASLQASATDTPAAAASACITSPAAVFTPSAPAGAPPASGSGGGGGGGSSAGSSGTSGTKGNGAVSFVGERNALAGMVAMASCVLGGMLWTLA